MKKTSFNLFVCLFVCLFVTMSLQSKAQLLNYKTNDLRGYVLVEKGEYDKFEMWEVELKQRSYTDSVHYEDSVVYRKRVLGQNYTKIPERFLNEDNHYILTVMGRDENGDVIATDKEEWGRGPIGSGNWAHNYYDYNCNGVNYAYRVSSHCIVSDGVVTNTGYLTLEDYTPNGSSKYVYFSWDDFASIAQNNPQPFTDYYGVSFSSIYNSGIDNINAIKETDVTSADELYGPNGHIVLGSGTEQTAVGIKKNMGYWKGHLIQTDTLAVVDNGWSVDQAIDRINMYAADDLEWYDMPELVCHRNGEMNMADSDDSLYVECFDDLYGSDWFENMEDGDFFDLIEDISDCINGEDDDWPWPDNITDISIYRLSSESSQIISLDEDDFVDDDGSIIAPDFVLDDGLYSIGFSFEDRSHLYSIMELENKIKNTLDMSDFFDVSVFPVPIYDEYFFVDINGSMSDIITYNLYDNQGNMIYTEKIKFYTDLGDKSFRVKIKPDVDIPEGNLVNEFLFSDGSSISVQSIK